MYLNPSEWITIFVLLYTHILSPKLPGPIETLLKNPLAKTFALFWLIYVRTRKWKFSLLIASGVVVILEGSCYIMYGREAFSDSHKNSWSPTDNIRIDETSKKEQVQLFLDDNDLFIKSLYDYVDIDQPDEISKIA
jgi:hypothetical protein